MPETEKNLDYEALQSLVVETSHLERLEVLLAQFNLFEALGAVRQELRHSCFLAFLLNPAENHGLGDDFVKRFLQKAVLSDGGDKPLPVSPIDLDLWDLNDIEVRREWQHIDILLLDERRRLAVIIENKIGSHEGPDQLDRYYHALKNSYRGWTILAIYLTPDGERPSHEDYVALDYATVCEIIEQLVERRSSTLGTDVRTLMVHYSQMLRRHIVSESEIAELCRQIYKKHQRALDLIYEQRPDEQAAITEVLKGLVDSEVRLVPDHFSKALVRFAAKSWDVPVLKSGHGWTPSGRILLFEFYNEPQRLNLKLYIGPTSDTSIRQRLFEMATRYKPPFNTVSRSLRKKWNSIYSKSFLTSKDYEEATIDELNETIQKRWADFVEKDLPRIEEVVSEEEWIRQSTAADPLM